MKSVTFQWFQPKYAEAYTGLRRYGAGDLVQAWSVTDLVARKEGDVRTLAGATTIAIGGFIAVGGMTAMYF